MTTAYFGFDFRPPRDERAPADVVTPVAGAVIRLDRDGRIVQATTEAAALLGYEPGDLAGRTLAELAAADWETPARSVTARILVGVRDVGELLLAGRSGRRTLLRMAARPADDGEAGGHIVVWTEVQALAPATAVREQDAELRRLAASLLSTQEAERTRLSAELHDGVAPLAIMAKFMVEDALQRSMRGAHAEATEILINAAARLRDLIGELRRISMELRPALLDDLGLLPTIEWFCRRLEQAYRCLRVERVVEVAEDDVPKALKLGIFRIVEEAVSNAAQHAAARCVRVSLTRRGNELRLAVADDGSGFDAAPVFEGNACLLGVGLQSIRQRVEATKGSLLLESSPMHGTVVGAVWDLGSPQRGAATEVRAARCPT